ncbi:hypothetical protein GBF38_019206 [Nibea albiflora]|uniref:Uncharacterized protein n=1 Tax=Nibea albiflora TaxID=240163 RepID=A0ACB7F119_NIBAL|nr:hypothetical protein GBF38_019206 [Nibea albiflora]
MDLEPALGVPVLVFVSSLSFHGNRDDRSVKHREVEVQSAEREVDSTSNNRKTTRGPGPSPSPSPGPEPIEDGGQLVEDSTPSSVWEEAQQTDGGSEVESEQPQEEHHLLDATQH